ncbi:MAG: hypothetical protein IT317_09130 [Anaerolineales bacterium]|nr:hypothetical protein [Anaerolineales bacterium]
MAAVGVVGVVQLALLAAPGLRAALAQGEAGAPAGSSALTRFITLTPAQALFDSPAYYTVGGGPNVSGIYMPNSSFNRFYTGFTLPPDYVAGSDVTLRIMWANGNSNATNCDFVLWANMLVAYRPGVTDWAHFAGGQFSNGIDTITLPAGATAQAVRAENLVIDGAGFSTAMQPRDALQIAIARDATDGSDTCTGSLVIVGLDATYESTGAFLPLTTR